MDFWLAVVIIVLLGCVTATVLTAIDKQSNARKLGNERELEALRERLRQREERIAELEAMNGQLDRQLAWHMQLAEGLGSGVRQQDGTRR